MNKYKSLGAKLNHAMAKHGWSYPLSEVAIICEVAGMGHGGHNKQDRIFFAKLGMELRGLIDQMKQFETSLETMSDDELAQLIDRMKEEEIDQLLERATRDADCDEQTDSANDSDERDPADDWKEGE